MCESVARTLKSENGFICGEVKPVTAASRQEFHAGIGLSLVRLKDQRKMAIGGEDLLVAFAGVEARRRSDGRRKTVGNLPRLQPGASLHWNQWSRATAASSNNSAMATRTRVREQVFPD